MPVIMIAAGNDYLCHSPFVTCEEWKMLFQNSAITSVPFSAKMIYNFLLLVIYASTDFVPQPSFLQPTNQLKKVPFGDGVCWLLFEINFVLSPIFHV